MKANMQTVEPSSRRSNQASRRPEPRPSRPRPSEQGYTLVELLVVLAILGLLIAIAAPRLIHHLSAARVQTAHIQMQQLGSILDIYKLDTGHYPTQQAGLSALAVAPAGTQNWNGPYLKNKDSLTDPWGNPYQYKFPGSHGDYDLYSFGADGREGGDGENSDITSWQQ
jgi:general secretion pathway protein G